MIEKIWLDHHAHAAPTSISLQSDENLVTMFYHACEQNEACAAMTQDSTTLTYGELLRHSHALAAYFMQKWQLKKSDRVAMLLPNVLAFPIVLFAAWQAGLIVIPMNPLYTTREIKKILHDAQVSAAITIESSAHKIAEILPELPSLKVMVVRFGDLSGTISGWLLHGYIQYVAKKIPHWSIDNAVLFMDALKVGSELAFSVPTLSSQDIALIQYTAGTTGNPKGVTLSHGNLLANTKQIYAVIYDIISTTSDPIRVITPLPMYHIFSLTTNLLLFLYIGAHNILILDPRRMHSFIKTLQKWPPMFITGVNTLYALLLQHPQLSQVNFSMLKVALAGGMKLQEDVAKRWHTIAGVPLSEGYGLSEASPVILVNDLHASEYTGALGRPLLSTQVKVCDEEGKEVRRGEVGELYVKGPQVMQGYWHNPSETEKVLVDGWLKTGDIVHEDEKGNFIYMARKGDILNVSGFKVSPHEIEAVVLAHPGVLEAAAVGITDVTNGSATINLYVVRSDPNLTQQELFSFCSQNLSSYKVPHHINFVESIPKNSVGKILYRELR